MSKTQTGVITDFIREINNMEKIPDNNILVALDVRFLYTNIPNKNRIEAVKITLKRKIQKRELS